MTKKNAKRVILILSALLIVLYFIPFWSVSEWFISVKLSAFNLTFGSGYLGGGSFAYILLLLFPIITGAVWYFKDKISQTAASIITIIAELLHLFMWMAISGGFKQYGADGRLTIVYALSILSCIAIIAFAIIITFVPRLLKGESDAKVDIEATIKSGFSDIKDTVNKVRPNKSWTCTSCGALMQGDSNFCTNCGAKKPEPKVCPSCQSPIQPGDIFCKSCGTKLDGNIAPAQAQAPAQVPTQAPAQAAPIDDNSASVVASENQTQVQSETSSQTEVPSQTSTSDDTTA